MTDEPDPWAAWRPFLDKQRVEFEESGNPLYAWEALTFCLSNRPGLALPDWIRLYLLRAALGHTGMHPPPARSRAGSPKPHAGVLDLADEAARLAGYLPATADPSALMRALPAALGFARRGWSAFAQWRQIKAEDAAHRAVAIERTPAALVAERARYALGIDTKAAKAGRRRARLRAERF